MSIDYKIYSQKERGFRHLRHHPRYFQEVPKTGLGGLFFPKEDEKAAQEKTKKEQEASQGQTKEIASKAQKAQQQAQNNAQVQQLKSSPIDRRGETKEERTERLKKESKEEFQKLKTEQQTFSEKSHYTQGESHRQLENRGPSLLQTIHSLTTNGESSTEKSYLSKENLPSFIKNSSKNSDQTGMKLGNMRGFIGESGAMAHEQWNQRASAGNRRLSGQNFVHGQPFSGLGGQNLSGSLKNLDSLNNLIKQIANQLPDTHPAFADKAAQGAAIFYNKNLLLVRDGDKMRLFRLLDDGTLFETTAEHQGKPLTQAAKRSISQALKERGLQARLHGEREVLGEKGKTTTDKSEKDGSLSARGELKALLADESTFAHLLRAALEEGKEIGDPLREGADPEFISKKDWNAFFGRMMKLGNAEEDSSKNFDEIMSFVFRGLFKKEDEHRLVSDVKYMAEGKKREEKFAQISILDDELFDALKGLKPGQPISKEMLEDFLGNKLNFIKLAHLISQADPIYASEILKHIKFNPTATVDPYSQARLEHHIFSQSKKKEPGEITGVFANPFPLQDKPKQEIFGNPKLYTLIAYVAGAFAVLLLLFFLLK